MTIAGFQNYWLAGAQAYFKRDNVGAQAYPIFDLGTLASATPSLEPTVVELFDNKSGRGVRVATDTPRITESWELALNNFAPNSRALLFMSGPPSEVSYSQTEYDTNQPSGIFVGGLFQILGADGEPALPLDAIAAVYSGTLTTSANVITAINVATRTITVSSDLTAVLDPGDPIIIHPDGLADPKHAGTYTILSMTASAIVLTTPLKGAANETAVTVDLSHGALVVGVEGTDWEIYDLELGIVKTGSNWAIPGGTLEDPVSARAIYQTAALTGRRLIKPQSVTGAIEGTMQLILSRGNNAQRTLRSFRCSLATGAMTIGNEAYSTGTLTANVLSDLTEIDNIAGTMLDFKGDIPSFS